MIQYLLGLLLVSFFLNGVAIVPFINLLYRLKFQRQKEDLNDSGESLLDKIHDWKAGTPIGGGVLMVVLTCLIYFLVIFLSRTKLSQYLNFSFVDETHILLLTFIGFGLLGLLDDWVKIFGKKVKGNIGFHIGLSGRVKFILQWVLGFVIALMLYLNLGLDFVHLPLTSVVIPLGWFFVPFAAFVIVFFANAFNISDGADGLSCGLLFVCLVAFMVIAFSVLDAPLAIFLAIWIGSIIAFLYFNVYPARIWLGDAGALAFGAALGLIGLLTGKVLALFLIGGIFVIELGSSFIQLAAIRLFKRKVFPIAPLHHAFEAVGWPEPKIVMRAWLAGIVLAIVGLWLALG